MYSWELEVDAKRTALAVMHDVINRILNSAIDLLGLIDSKGRCKRRQDISQQDEKFRRGCRNLRIILTRELAEIGSFTDINISVLCRAYFNPDLKGQISMIVEMIFKVSEMRRAISIRPLSIMEQVQTYCNNKGCRRNRNW